MAQPQMTRELAGLEIDLTNVDINCGHATHSHLRNKSQIPKVFGENNLPLHYATNNAYNDEAATSSNLHSPPLNYSPLVMLVKTQPECNVISTAYGTVS